MSDYFTETSNNESVPCEPPAHVKAVGSEVEAFTKYLHAKYGAQFMGVLLVPVPNANDGANDALGITTLCDHCFPGVNGPLIQEMMAVVGKHIPCSPPMKHKH